MCLLGRDTGAITNISVQKQIPLRSSWTGSYQLRARRCLYSALRWSPAEEQFLRQMECQSSKPTNQQLIYLQQLYHRAQRVEQEIGYVLS